MLSGPSIKEVLPAPAHVAIIMDGNGRWAKARGLPRAEGHRHGAEAVRVAVEGSREHGVVFLTLYAFSSENWKRPADEVDDLMGLIRVYLTHEVKELHNNNVRLRCIGDRVGLADDIIKLIENAERKTATNTGLTLQIAVNYGSHWEIVQACRNIASSVVGGKLLPEEIDESVLSANLQTADVPDPDVLIRTSGEKRLSNFLLWQSAYAELIFIDTLWPDFSKETLTGAIQEYHRRDRRYGEARV